MKEPLKILILEDNANDAEIIQHLLLKENLCCQFGLANNKDSYLAALDQLQPDIILSDHQLPYFNSTDALAIARRRFPGIPFIMVTGTASEEFAAGIIKAGADDYILKDRMARLPAAINAAVQLRRSEREKLEAAEKLKRSEENYRNITERVSDGLVAFDKDWYYTYANKRAGEILKRKPEELIGKYCWTEFPDMIGQPFYHACLKAMKEQQNIHIEEYYSTVHARLEIDLYPSPNGLSILLKDTTERKDAEHKIIQSEANLKVIFENTSEGFLLINRKAVVQAYNKKAECYTMFSKAKEIEIGRSIYDSIEASRQDFFKEIIARALHGESISYERSYDMGNGKISWIDFSITPVLETGQVTGVCINGRDVTEKKVIEQQREFDRDNLKALINNTHDLMWSVDRDLNLITANEAFDKMVKAMPDQIVAKSSDSPASDVNGKSLNRFYQHYQRAFSGE
ncbi:MAG: hypothetical protein JWM28_3475, partial [Chitinophagaceae bacterium]|nr:hypothetical protein [Chitinophagaceae bacterium]